MADSPPRELSAAAPPVCTNCGAAMHGRFCAKCGQDGAATAVTLRGLMRDYLMAYVAYDGLAWRTLAMLVWKPGQLALDFFAGKRARYLHPRRLYLFTSIVYFLCFSSSGNMMQGPLQIDCSPLASRHFGADDIDIDVPIYAGDGLGARLGGQPPVTTHTPAINRKFVEALNAKKARLLAMTPLQACERFLDVLRAKIPAIAFLLLPFFALILKAFYWRRSYVEHLLFSVYEHSFAFVIFFAAALADLAHLDTLSGILGLTILIHVFIALRRVYGRSWLGTTWRFLGIAIGYFSVFVTVVLFVALYAAWGTV